MKIAVMSDLHVEFDRAHFDNLRARGKKPKKRRTRKTLELLNHPSVGPNLGELVRLGPQQEVTALVDLVILAGDIDLGPLSAAYGGKISEWLGVPVLLIAGNHEFYGGEYVSTLNSLRTHCQEYAGLNFLERDRLDIEDSSGPIRILGCTLWSDFLLFGEDRYTVATNAATRYISDFSGQIEFGTNGWFKPEHAAEIFTESVAWLTSELVRDYRGRTIIVTHHAPAFRSVPQHFRRDLTSAAYASALEDLVQGSGATFWIHGHIHSSLDYWIGNTRILCNPRGYRGHELNKKFKAGYRIEI